MVGLVERGGKARMFHLNDATKVTVRDVLVRNADRASTLYTDESRLYTRTGEEYAAHKTTKHSAGEYVRYEDGASIHSNTIENVFSAFMRGMVGVYQRCFEAHLHRYLAEFDFRDNCRAISLIRRPACIRSTLSVVGRCTSHFTYRHSSRSAVTA